MNLTVSTVNLNGARAAVRKGFDRWLAETSADVVCLQEVRAELDEIPDAVQAPDGWHVLVAPSIRRGHAGVALYSRIEPEAGRIGFGSAEFDTTGRYVEIDLPSVTVASLYLPSGRVEAPRLQEEKERFMGEFLKYLHELRARERARGRDVLVCGDWNIAHQKTDVKNWRSAQRRAGFLPDEREWMTRVITEAGFVDVVRTLRPDEQGPYSWWSYQANAFANDSGWRLDYHMATPGLAERAREVRVERASSEEARWSDHSPVTVEYAKA